MKQLTGYSLSVFCIQSMTSSFAPEPDLAGPLACPGDVGEEGAERVAVGVAGMARNIPGRGEDGVGDLATAGTLLGYNKRRSENRIERKYFKITWTEW